MREGGLSCQCNSEICTLTTSFSTVLCKIGIDFSRPIPEFTLPAPFYVQLYSPERRCGSIMARVGGLCS